MKAKFIKGMTALLTLALSAGLFAGCGQNSKENGNAGSTSDNKETKQTTYKYWVPMHPDYAKQVGNLGECEVYKELEKRTGVKVEFIHPAQGQQVEQFNLMIASNDLPDIIGREAASYPGGPEKAVQDGKYIRLNELIDKHAPNFKKLRTSTPDIERETVLDSGLIWSFPVIHETVEGPWAGLFMRKDFLDKLGMPVPETMDEWEKALEGFKSLGVKHPMVLNWNDVAFMGLYVSAFGTHVDFIKVNDKVKYGPIEPGYKDFLTTMNRWYKNGLIDPEFAARDGKIMEAFITNSETGVFSNCVEVDFVYEDAIRPKDPKADIVPVPYPSLKKGEVPQFRQSNSYWGGCDTAITSACKNPEEIVKWFDYRYGDEGFMLFNYGIEGKSYKMVDGKPQRMSELGDALKKIIPQQDPYKRDWSIGVNKEKQEETRKVWEKAGTAMVLPRISQTKEEQEIISQKNTEIGTYVKEMTFKFIMGVEPISKFDSYVEQVKKMGIDDVVKAKQGALDRYMKR